MDGAFISLEECILDGLNDPNSFRAARMQAALMQIPLDTLATLDEGQTERVLLLMNTMYDNSRDIDPEEKTPIDEAIDAFEEIVSVVLIKVYQVLEIYFECTALCEPGYFYLGSIDITTGPPKQGCLEPFKVFVADNFFAWSLRLGLVLFGVYTLLGFICCLNRKNFD
jgi:hypothetical protein